MMTKKSDDQLSDPHDDSAPPDATDDRDDLQDRRARRRQLVQDDLTRVAVRLFLDRGYAAVSVEEVAAAAGMSERTFFRYFPSKEAVLRRYRGSLSARLLRSFRSRPDGEAPLMALRNAFVSSSHVAEADRSRVHALEQLLSTTPDVWAKDLGETVADAPVARELARRMGASSEELGPLVLAAAVSAAAATGWSHWARSAGDADPGDVVATAIDELGLPRFM